MNVTPPESPAQIATRQQPGDGRQRYVRDDAWPGDGRTYRMDAKQITEFFGADRKLTSILTPHVGKFLKSDALLRLPSGNERAEPTVRKTVRVLRMFLIWARDTGYIDKLPLPKDVPLGRCAANPDHTATRDAARQS